MAWVFPLLLLAWPAVEIAVLIKVANWLGWPGAIAGIILSGLAGLALLRRQGLATARRAQVQLRQGEMPMGALFDAACLALAGGLLMVPGFVTDLLAILLLIPPIRHRLGRFLASRLVIRPAATPGILSVLPSGCVSRCSMLVVRHRRSDLGLPAAATRAFNNRRSDGQLRTACQSGVPDDRCPRPTDAAAAAGECSICQGPVVRGARRSGDLW